MSYGRPLAASSNQPIVSATFEVFCPASRALQFLSLRLSTTGVMIRRASRTSCLIWRHSGKNQ